MSEDDPVPGLPRMRGRPRLKVADVWDEYAKRQLQGAMASEGVGYKRLAQMLKEDDEASSETEASLMRRINRGAFSHAFALRVLRVLGVASLDISRMKTSAERSAAVAKKTK